MEMNPQGVRSAAFKTVRKGADPDEVRAFLSDVADELERAQNQSTAMEARARAAVARLQELNESATAAAAAPPVEASAEEAETISRTLLLAQRTADQTVSGARAEAEQILRKANDEAAKTLDSTREMSAQILEEARIDARKIGEAERLSVSGEVEALKARRDFLESDVHELEAFLADQRARVREAATSLLDIADRVPGGLGDVRAPLLSASDDDAADDDAADDGAADDDDESVAATFDDGARSEELLIVTEIADDSDGDGEEASMFVEADEEAVSDLNIDPWADEVSGAGDATEAIPVFRIDDDDAAESTGRDESGEEFRFSFDDERS
jgi:DivIVA domain-containing protein